MRVRNRRQAREAALKALYEVEIGGTALEDAIAEMHAAAALPEELARFAEELVRGVVEDADRLKRAIEPCLRDWSWDRLAVVDRTLLRIAAFEVFHRSEIPPSVTLDEAIELAKKYSTAESGKFVNGVLGALLQTSPKVDWKDSQGAAPIEDGAPPEQAPQVLEVGPDAPEVEELAKAGLWRIRSGESER